MQGMSPAYAQRLLDTIDAAVPALLALPAQRTGDPLAPGKWSPREIVGHLIDSASNNHRRFVVGRWQDDLIFDGYAQDDWVNAQQYREAPWADLVMLWSHFNRHMARVMASVPEAVRTRPRATHNLDRIAWRPLPADLPATLDYFMDDYVGHLRHHLKQILGAEWDTERDAHGA
jgi:DinB superfamily